MREEMDKSRQENEEHVSKMKKENDRVMSEVQQESEAKVQFVKQEMEELQTETKRTLKHQKVQFEKEKVKLQLESKQAHKRQMGLQRVCLRLGKRINSDREAYEQETRKTKRENPSQPRKENPGQAQTLTTLHAEIFTLHRTSRALQNALDQKNIEMLERLARGEANLLEANNRNEELKEQIVSLRLVENRVEEEMTQNTNLKAEIERLSNEKIQTESELKRLVEDGKEKSESLSRLVSSNHTLSEQLQQTENELISRDTGKAADLLKSLQNTEELKTRKSNDQQS
ncbi:hypothetical protein BLNAU_25050 [Blattamonas nauphoetae]|uniref:Uncharacterized protein n=1 Tax=Blattamonas nauphoetae TaxID=2049346 RepID=A0ABQ9WLI2_9EUKA|nr:hypothetical protein BLNAU_25050 [Blattamonas nauphoetae]